MNTFDIIIPCKGLASGKSRLSDLLTPREREDLCRRMLKRTIEVAKATTGRNRVIVVSADPRVRAIAVRLAITAIDDEGRNLNEALDFANASMSDPPAACGLMILPIDLPLVTADLLCDAAERTMDMGVAPDAAGTGTNLLTMAPRVRKGFPFSFGPDSFRLHCEAANARGAAVTVLHHTHLAFDLDRTADLSALRTLNLAGLRALFPV